ncbi:MAG TPA: hypothetical protein P5301_00270 [Bacteroidales bacterium]|nr:hypothetical protein [Bacteroidales bacterium]HRR51895.1 hypothetical protein [Bacteroidales bacterium]
MKLVNTDKDKFSYDKKFLDKIVVAMLKDEKFLLKCLDLDIVQYIDSGTHIYIIKFILDFYKTYSTIPTMDSIKIKIQE